MFLSQLSLKISCAGLIIPVRVKMENALYPQNEITVPNTERNSRVGKKKYMKCTAKHRLDDGIKINHKSGKNKNRNIHISNRLSLGRCYRVEFVCTKVKCSLFSV